MTVSARRRRLRAPTPFELFVGLCFALAAQLLVDWARAPAACIGGHAHGWSDSETVDGVDRPRGVPCTQDPARAP